MTCILRKKGSGIKPGTVQGDLRDRRRHESGCVGHYARMSDSESKPGGAVEVKEPALLRRVRRPSDLFRLVLVLVGLVGVVALPATFTAGPTRGPATRPF